MIHRAFIFLFLLIAGVSSYAQSGENRQKVRTVTIPISIFTKQELEKSRAEEFVRAERLIVREDADEQQILSIRSVSTTPLSIALLIQEDLAGNFNLQLPDIKDFIRRLPPGTRVMTAYLRTGTVQIRQRFTDDLNKAANSLRIVAGTAALAPRSPYDGVDEILGRFDSVPSGRRAILLFSDGLDTSEGLTLAAANRSRDLDRAILKAQRKSVAVYSFYSPTARTESGSSTIALAAQGTLSRLSDETGGRSFGNGIIAPISYMPFFREMVMALDRQFALTYLSTHMNKGYHKVVVQSTNPDIRIEHPKGYYYR